jgi:hypothetical protein
MAIITKFTIESNFQETLQYKEMHSPWMYKRILNYNAFLWHSELFYGSVDNDKERG